MHFRYQIAIYGKFIKVVPIYFSILLIKYLEINYFNFSLKNKMYIMLRNTKFLRIINS